MEILQADIINDDFEGNNAFALFIVSFMGA